LCEKLYFEKILTNVHVGDVETEPEELKLLARSSFNLLIITTLQGLLKTFLLSAMNLNNVTLQRFIQSKVFLTRFTFNQCPLCVFKFKIKSDIKVHIKAKHAQLSFMLCFNMDLKIRFYFEFDGRQKTKVECKSCEKNFTLNESLMYHIIEVHGKQCKHFKEALEDEAEGCDDEEMS
jgi:hypothetical protein